ncbi:MAG: pirin family protein [Methanoregulaceae archaeon]|nr:pirin family protein [Methanoregulaceae archaeon]
MEQVRGTREVFSAHETIEGAGVRLHRAFGYGQVPLFDPFLMLDDFRAGNDPAAYLPGFPWHPHRGIETVTYMLDGKVEHGDSMGNSGVIGAGDIQWMTAGSGIIHQEMPKPVNGLMGGFQLWVNLPKSHKMMRPRYQEIKAGKVPTTAPAPGVSVRVISGEFGGVRGPVEDIITAPSYADVSMEEGAEIAIPVARGDMAAAYVIGGTGTLGSLSGSPVENRDVLLFGDGDVVNAASLHGTFRFLLITGRPIGEPVAWGGPIVMNTQDELRQAIFEYRTGTFIKEKQAIRPEGG